MVESRLGAEELPGVRDAAHVELHGVGIDPNGDGPVLDQPLSHLGLVLGNLDAAIDRHLHLGLVEVALLVHGIVLVVILGLKSWLNKIMIAITKSKD